MATNHLHALRLSADDRRYSILDTNKTTLQEFLNKEYDGKKEEFFAELFSEQVVHDFGAYLLQHVITSDMKRPFKNRTAIEAMHASTVDWEHAFLSELCLEFAGKELTLKEASVKLSDYITGAIKLSSTGLATLSSKYPGIFEVCKRKKPDDTGKRPLTIYIQKTDEQLKYPGIND
jgi:hypothetical protein